MTNASTTNARKTNARMNATRIDSIVSLTLVSGSFFGAGNAGASDMRGIVIEPLANIKTPPSLTNARDHWSRLYETCRVGEMIDIPSDVQGLVFDCDGTIADTMP